MSVTKADGLGGNIARLLWQGIVSESHLGGFLARNNLVRPESTICKSNIVKEHSECLVCLRISSTLENVVDKACCSISSHRLPHSLCLVVDNIVHGYFSILSVGHPWKVRVIGETVVLL